MRNSKQTAAVKRLKTGMIYGGWIGVGLILGLIASAGAATDDNPGNLRFLGQGVHYITNGKLGIGTVTPHEKLEINGNLRLGNGPTSGEATLSAPVVEGDSTLRVDSTAGFSPFGGTLIIGRWGNYEIVNYLVANANVFSGVSRGQMGTTTHAFSVGTPVSNYLLTVLSSEMSTPRMVVDGRGHLGLGTYFPQTNLDVADSTQVRMMLRAEAGFGGNLTLSASDSGATINGHGGRPGESHLVLANNGSEVVRLTNQMMGVGGIGDPKSLLHVQAQGYLQFSKTSYGPPPAVHCDNDELRGRLSIDTLNNRLYICNGAARGWDYIPLTN